MPVTTASGTSTSGFGVGVGDGATVALGADEDAEALASGGAAVGVASVLVQAARRTNAATPADAREDRIGADGSGWRISAPSCATRPV
jgi:hypothetical protein